VENRVIVSEYNGSGGAAPAEYPTPDTERVGDAGVTWHGEIDPASPELLRITRGTKDFQSVKEKHRSLFDNPNSTIVKRDTPEPSTCGSNDEPRATTTVGQE
jgi:hypothetical protein